MLGNNLDDLLPSGAATTPQLREAAKAWAARNRTLAAKELRSVITSLIRDRSALRKTMAGILLGYMPVQRRQLNPGLYDDWLEHTEGWAAVDAICYNNFTAAEMLEDFGPWKVLITQLARSDNPNKRRGAIVLLTKPVKQSADPRLSSLAFGLIDTLCEEKDILITKAISWLLRHLTTHHAPAVRQYLNANRNKLPAIAIRETTHKLQHGTKSPPKRSPQVRIK
jgi:3-methyladenine DNA glycosylase AlkD